ncbi:MAG TPA: pilus assembly protein PilY, partial [Geobacteraceae bacterium]|nr:pilus assembly protein PilY [Geobacteraceae bacterium]
GNPALLCGSGYAGQYYSTDSVGNWVLTGTDSNLAEAEYRFCNNVAVPPVTDPTDAPSNTAITDNLPSILSGLGVEAQLGSPVATVRAKLATTTVPTGLVQQFGTNIRLGVMSFNPFGSAAETALIGVPKVCSNDPFKVCTLDIDCGGTNTCDPTTSGSTNLDGGRILYPIGFGLCATMTTTPCTVDADCSGFNTCLGGYCGTKGSTVCTTAANCSGSSQACISNGVGSHTTSPSLVKALDDIKASSWTPFSEAFYDAIGYFARIPTGVDAGKSRTALRLNSLRSTSTDYTDFTTAPADFNENYNPSEYRCQQNYILLVSDGASTADRNSNTRALATLYASPAGITQVSCTGAPTGTTLDYGGNNNLPIMSWLAKNRNISNFNLTSPASTDTAGTARDSITSYVVFNGESNGASGDCNSYTLLKKTAEKGGTALKQANDYPGLVAALTGVFQDVAARAASGTAASILSNSEGSGANILQAVFFPKKIFENQTAVNWIGEMQNLWYFVDPYINNSTIREDTDSDHKLNLINDYVARFTFDTTADKTMVQLFQDTDGDGTGDAAVGGLIDPDYVKSLWRAGKLLWQRNITSSPRNLLTSLDGSSLINFSSSTFPGGSVPDNSAALAPYLNLTAAEAPKLVDWVHGQDQSGYRERTVSIKDPVSGVVTSGVWRLGDIISSTPRVQSTVRLNTYNLPQPGGYSDNSYLSYINSNQYQNRGMVYVGGNDGLFHAFNLGILSVKSTGFQKASLTGTDLGKEMWAYVPKNVLPYMKYLSDPAYGHLYYVDGRTSIFDASIGYTDVGTCTRSTYENCAKLRNSSVVDSSNNLDPAKNTWRTVVIGGMGLGGASAKSCAAGNDCVQTPIADPADATKGLGYSSYFAFDVTDPTNPSLLWEFSDPDLGYSMSGPAIVRVGDKEKNGKWYAVFGSGPTGPIDTASHQFKGRSNQNLKFFVVDLQTGVLVKTIDTGIANAFAGSMMGGSIDIDRGSPGVAGNYQDDAVYVGYVRKDTATNTWTRGGVGRINTMESLDPADTTAPWVWRPILSDIGPVTTAISRLQDKKNRNLWLFFGAGRYFYRESASLDDYNGNRRIFGMKDPCYNTTAVPGNFLDKSCTDTVSAGTMVDQTSSISTIAAGNAGWYIHLDAETATEAAERVVTDTVALTNGSVFFTSFKPTMDICGYGGNSYLWGVKYDTGGQAAASALQGKALIQLSTGEFKEVDLATAFQDKNNRRMQTPMTGKPPSDAPPIISNSMNKPIKKILHIQEH